MPVYFPYLQFDRDSKKKKKNTKKTKTWWCVTRVAVIKGLYGGKEGEYEAGGGGSHTRSKVFFLFVLSAVW